MVCIGEVQVDTGSLVIADPINLDNISKKEFFGKTKKNSGRVSLEVCDGMYKVWGEKVSYKKMGKKIHMKFISHDKRKSKTKGGKYDCE